MTIVLPDDGSLDSLCDRKADFAVRARGFSAPLPGCRPFDQDLGFAVGADDLNMILRHGEAQPFTNAVTFGASAERR
jgi:hypothetical protein